MKHLICILFATLLFCSCQKTNEDKAKDVIQQYLKENLNDWNSYESVKFSALDSAFTRSLESPEVCDAKNNFDFWNRMSKEYAAYGAIDSMKYYLEEYKKAIADFNPEFMGYSMAHSFRANNETGNKTISEYKFYFDTNISRIVEITDLKQLEEELVNSK